MDQRRAPHRVGHRTTLKVPDGVLSAARELADELGTSTNDAIVRLAEEGTAARQRRLEARRMADERRAAIAEDGRGVGLDYPESDALRAAMLMGRDES